MPAGRPKIYDVQDIIDKLEKYIVENDEPMVLEFCVNYGINRSYLYELANKNEELSNTIKKAIQKEECFLVKNGERQKINPVFAMFRLKQPAFGYKDKQEVESVNVNVNTEIDSEKTFESKATEEEKANRYNLSAVKMAEILNR